MGDEIFILAAWIGALSGALILAEVVAKACETAARVFFNQEGKR